MSVEEVSALFRMAMQTTLFVAAPILAGATTLGLGISILQAATQVNEQTLTFVPKVVLVLGLFAVIFPWMMQNVLDFALMIFEQVEVAGRR